ncbi:condensation domain-containing protein, partial [Clostridium cibarium]
IYKTGDLARILPDGNIEFLGRIDSQVKIRGFRIELGEVENAILSNKKVKEVVLVVNEDDEKKICGYYTGAEIEELELRTYISNKLPNYMMPSFLMRLEKMPLTPNGKIDKKALPKAEVEISTNYIEPRNHIEKSLSDIWSEIIGVKKIGLRDDFFELGGHSLKAINIVYKINKEFNINIQVQDVFEKTTIEAMGLYLQELLISSNEAATTFENGEEVNFKEIQKAEIKSHYEVSLAQNMMYIINQINTSSYNYNVPTAYLVEGKLDKEKLENVVRQLIDRHESLRTRFTVIDNITYQVIDENVDFKIEYLRYKKDYEDNEESILDIVSNFKRLFNLRLSPLIRVVLLELNDKSILFMDIHHIVVDGVSMNIIIKELAELYNGNSLEPLNLQYKDFSEWQNKLIKAGEIDKQKDFWLNYLDENIEKLDLPRDYDSEDKYSFKGGDINIKLDQTIVTKIDKFVKEMQITKFIFMFSAVSILLNKYTLKEKIIISTPVSGRTNSDLNNIVGMFVNTLPIKINITDFMNLNEFLHDVKLQLLSVFENQDYPVESLVGELSKQRKLNNNSLFDVIFSYEYDDLSVESIGDAKIKPLDLKTNVSKNELTIVASEGEELTISSIYDSSIFKEETIDEMLANLENIIIQMLEQPQMPIKNIGLIDDESTEEGQDDELDDLLFDL